MVPTESEQAKKAKSKKVIKTRGKVGFDNLMWNYMKKQLMLTETEMIKLTQASCPAKVNGLAANLVLFFNTDTAKAKGVTIEDYVSLTEHPELVVYEGYYVRGNGGEISLKKWEGVGTSLLAEKQKQGVITEVGLVAEKTGAQKFLSGFGHFLAMGGFMLMILLIVIIAVAISVLTKSC